MIRCSFFVAPFALYLLATAAAESDELESLVKQAGQNYQTQEGQSYLEAFQHAIMPVFGNALDTCSSTAPDTTNPAAIVFIVAANGTVRRLIYSTDIPFVECVAAKLRVIKTLPKPPHDGWVVAVGAVNHHHEEPAQGKSQ